MICLCSLSFHSCREEEKQPVVSVEPRPDTIINIAPARGANPYATVDVSPMDMSYFPVDYPKLKMANHNAPPPVMRVIYSRPHLQGRHLFTNLLKYGEPWRLGANESTEIQFYRPVSINDKTVKPGRYIIYCIPQENTWTIALNTHVDSWGLEQDSAKDVHRFTIPAQHEHGGPSIEYYTMVFQKTDYGADLVMAWGDLLARLPIKF